MTTAKPESKLRTKMIKRFRELDCPGRIHAVHGGAYTSTGEPDLDGVLCGVPLKVEIKVRPNKPTPKQELALREWAAAGAVTAVVHDMAEFDAVLITALERADRIARFECQATEYREIDMAAQHALEKIRAT